VELAALGEFVDARTSKSDVQNSKPSPDVFTSALSLLQVQPQDAVVIGDTPYDIIAAKKIGCRRSRCLWRIRAGRTAGDRRDRHLSRPG
jgi:HAD superfamily hydrolase (TIGR01509 family)